MRYYDRAPRNSQESARAPIAALVILGCTLTFAHNSNRQTTTATPHEVRIQQLDIEDQAAIEAGAPSAEPRLTDWRKTATPLPIMSRFRGQR